MRRSHPPPHYNTLQASNSSTLLAPAPSRSSPSTSPISSISSSSSSSLLPSSLPSRVLTSSRSTQHSLLSLVVAPSLFLCHLASATPIPSVKREDNPPPAIEAALTSSLLPAQIGGIVGSYAASLIIVAVALLILSKKRREHLNNGDNEVEFLKNVDKPQQVAAPLPEPAYPEPPPTEPPLSPLSIARSIRSIPRSPVVLNPSAQYSQFPGTPKTTSHSIRSIPRSPVVLNINTQYNNSTQFAPFPNTPKTTSPHTPYVYPSPTSTARSPLGIDLGVDQRVVESDRNMAQAKLEDMYKYVMEHEEAKANGKEAPPIPILTGNGNGNGHHYHNNSSGSLPGIGAGASRPSTAGAPTPKREKFKPAQLNLAGGDAQEDKRQSKASSIFSALRSPGRKKMKGMSISSPMMTPMSDSFSRESQEMSAIPPRQYAPAPPPPVPTDQLPFRAANYGNGNQKTSVVPLTPDLSPDGTQSIDERLNRLDQGPRGSHSRNTSGAPTEGGEPVSAGSERSVSPLVVGLPQSPKPGVNRFPALPATPRSTRGPPPPSLPLSPKPGSSFSRGSGPSAVRTGGVLPFRAYEPPLASPTSSTIQTKQTTFERRGPLSPSGAMTPYTGVAAPYSPYQPFTPLVPFTPSLVTKADRKRMRRLEPKTPTLAMVKSTEDLW